MFFVVQCVSAAAPCHWRPHHPPALWSHEGEVSRICQNPDPPELEILDRILPSLLLCVYMCECVSIYWGDNDMILALERISSVSHVPEPWSQSSVWLWSLCLSPTTSWCPQPVWRRCAEPRLAGWTNTAPYLPSDPVIFSHSLDRLIGVEVQYMVQGRAKM